MIEIKAASRLELIKNGIVPKRDLIKHWEKCAIFDRVWGHWRKLIPHHIWRIMPERAIPDFDKKTNIARFGNESHKEDASEYVRLYIDCPENHEYTLQVWHHAINWWQQSAFKCWERKKYFVEGFENVSLKNFLIDENKKWGTYILSEEDLQDGL